MTAVGVGTRHRWQLSVKVQDTPSRFGNPMKIRIWARSPGKIVWAYLNSIKIVREVWSVSFQKYMYFAGSGLHFSFQSPLKDLLIPSDGKSQLKACTRPEWFLSPEPTKLFLTQHSISLTVYVWNRFLTYFRLTWRCSVSRSDHVSSNKLMSYSSPLNIRQSEFKLFPSLGLNRARAGCIISNKICFQYSIKFRRIFFVP